MKVYKGLWAFPIALLLSLFASESAATGSGGWFSGVFEFLLYRLFCLIAGTAALASSLHYFRKGPVSLALQALVVAAVMAGLLLKFLA